MGTATLPARAGFRMTVDQYDRLTAAGLLAEADRCELVGGKILCSRVYAGGLPVPYRFAPGQLAAAVARGILSDDDAAALPVGENPPPMARNPPHDSTLDLLTDAVRTVLPAGWRPREQKALTLPTGSPEPDLAVVEGPAVRYALRHPGPADVAFVAEVADSSLRFDRTEKLADYAGAGIALYWVVNLIDRRIEVFSDPDGKQYRSRRDYTAGARVPVVIRGSVVGEIAVDAILA